MRSIWKIAVRAAYRKGGGIGLMRWVNRSGVRIFMYHRFSDAQALERQCRHLRTHYRPVSLNKASEMLRGKIPLVPYSVAVTVDDGYRDFYTVAYPVFSAFEIPVTVYLVTDFIDGRLWPWVDQVRYAFRNTVHSRFEITLPNGKPLAFSCVDENERIAAGRSTCEALKQLEDRDRVAVLQLLPQLLGVELPADPPGGGEPLGWDEVQSMARAGVEFGAHTRTHPILSKVGSRSVLEDEIAGSKRRIEEILEVPVRHFCYPNGSVQDVSPEAVEVVRQAGFETAVTTQGGLNVPMGDMLRLRRIAVDPAYDPQYFAQCAAAFRV